ESNSEEIRRRQEPHERLPAWGPLRTRFSVLLLRSAKRASRVCVDSTRYRFSGASGSNHTLFWEDFIMSQWWLASRRRGGKKAQTLRTILHLECLEERNLLTNSLVVVPNPPNAGQTMNGAAALAANDIWGVGSNQFIDPTTGAIDEQPLAD